MKADAFDE